MTGLIEISLRLKLTLVNRIPDIAVAKLDVP